MRRLGRHAGAKTQRRIGGANRSGGFTLIELVVTLTVLTILTIGVIPLIKVSVKRQREQQLRESLREMRTAIEQFHREAIAGQALRGAGQQQSPPGTPPQPVDPRVKVGITDDTVFGVDNPDRYPPDLETMVKGVSVTTLGAVGPPAGKSIFEQQATSNTLTTAKKKVYLRKIPIDPMTGEAEWELRSTYDASDATSWGGENVFDVRSKSTGTALNGEKYSDW